MGKYEWLLFLHVSGAFFLIGGSSAAAAFNFSALRRERPSEIALLLGLTRVAVRILLAGALLTIVFGLWLVHFLGYGYGKAWIVGALLLWLYGNIAGGIGGRREGETRKLAERLAAEGDAPSAELRARLRDPLQIVLLYSAGLAAIVVLVLMVWKPGQ